MALLPRGLALVLVHVCLLHSVWSKLELSVQDSVEVLLGAPALIPCDYSFGPSSQGPPFVMLQWFVRSPGNSSRARVFYGDSEQQLVDNNTEYSQRLEVISETNRSVLTIRDVRLSDHQREFFCQVNGLAAGSAEGKTALRVYAPPEAPVIEAVPHGISVTEEQPAKIAVCEAQNGFPKPNITWYKNGELLESSPGQVKFLVLHWRSSSGLFTVQNTLLLRVHKETRDALFSCRVSFSVPGGERSLESSPVNVTVHYPTSMVELWKESPPGLLREGDTVELRCQGDGHPPPTFIFTREQQPDIPLDSRGDVLILSSVSRKDSGLYQCRPTDPHSSSDAKGEVQLTVHYLDAAVVVPAETEIMYRGEALTATCNALSSLQTSTTWYKGGHVVGTGSSLLLQDASYQNAGEYVCEVTVPALPALHTQSSVHIVVHGTPQVESPEQEVRLEHPSGRVLNLSCEAQGSPAPTLTWSLSAAQSWEEVVSHSSSHSSLSVVSVRVSADFSAVCNASNDLGSDARLFSVKAVPMVTAPAAFSPAEGSGIFIVVIILGLLLLAILGSVIYFLHKKNRLPCGRSGKQSITKEKASAKDIVVEMKTEESVLLRAVNGDKRAPAEQ
ncbi:LOW QUALITY PROTEIN: cell surface glycoprotein MUC18 [Boleophthalmus pectinirostris]|uniref:LOW QUALITY PROTEIN: cell surface glycoprotein MUC18 n=1 Tax=Boleophthalmus pectinirostris TaxID=150288 RepID=UPI00242B745C|nr:LOW QUALITY PROTEIN: cell surface glycoprotein MUC18 [Boleophthalmus pectinirostris]